MDRKKAVRVRLRGGVGVKVNLERQKEETADRLFRSAAKDQKHGAGSAPVLTVSQPRRAGEKLMKCSSHFNAASKSHGSGGPQRIMAGYPST